MATQQTTVTSKQFNLDLPDVWKGLIVAVLAPVFMLLLGVLTTNSFDFDWKLIGTTAAASFLGYILKNFLTPSSVMVQNVTNETADKVKEGDAKVTITNA